MFEHALGGASHQQIIHRVVPMGSHDNQIGINRVPLVEDFFGHGSNLVDRYIVDGAV